MTASGRGASEAARSHAERGNEVGGAALPARSRAPRGNEAYRGGALIMAACLAILVVAAVLRVCGALCDLWLDEILAVTVAGQISSPLDILRYIHSEINHHLYTAYLYFVGPGTSDFIYRLPSLLAGIGAVAMAGVIGRRRSAADALIAMLLVGFSYPLVLYSSEARGYSEAVFLAFLSFYLLDRYLETRGWPWAAAFSLAVVLGFLAQLTFLSFYFSALFWSIYRLTTLRVGLKKIAISLLSCHAIPLLFLAAFYFVDIRKIAGIGGNPSPSLIGDYGTALAWAVGTPMAESAQFLACVIGVIAFWAAVQLLWREKSDLYVFFPSVILVFPILLVVIRGSDAIHVRYFLIGMAFLLLVSSFVLASLWRSGRAGGIACAALLVAFLAVNGWHTASLVRYGRGHYREVLQFMAANSECAVMTIGSDHDFRMVTVLRYYGPRVLGRQKAEYLDQASWPPYGPEWLIRHGGSTYAAVAGRHGTD